jgi:formylglycine-generating enzyme required for sulfatase activity
MTAPVWRAIFAAAFALALAWVVNVAAGQEAEVPVPALAEVPAGPFVAGSDRAERDAAYRLDEIAYGHNKTKIWQWYEKEQPRQTLETGAFRITATAITNRQYAAFVAATGYPPPDIDRETWESYKLVHPYKRTRRHAWTDGQPPKGREDHPVVLVSLTDALAYAAWLSELTGQTWRLPSEVEWEKAARGTDGRRFPWGQFWNPQLANTHDMGPFDTQPVGAYPRGASPFGLLDPAGQVFEWTATASAPGRYLVKGGSWDDKGCGVCRPAARHGRPEGIKHILIGFRLVVE